MNPAFSVTGSESFPSFAISLPFVMITFSESPYSPVIIVPSGASNLVPTGNVNSVAGCLPETFFIAPASKIS